MDRFCLKLRFLLPVMAILMVLGALALLGFNTALKRAAKAEEDSSSRLVEESVGQQTAMAEASVQKMIAESSCRALELASLFSRNQLVTASYAMALSGNPEQPGDFCVAEGRKMLRRELASTTEAEVRAGWAGGLGVED